MLLKIVVKNTRNPWCLNCLNLLNWNNHSKYQTLFYEESQPQDFIRNTSVHIITTKYHNSTDHNLFRAFESVFATYLLLIKIISHRIFMDWNAITFLIFNKCKFNFWSNAEHEMPKKEILIQRKWVEIRLRIPTYLLHSWNSYECRFWAKPDQLFKLPEFVKYQTHSYATKRRLLLRKWNLIRIPQFQPNRLQHNRVNSNLK